MRASRLAVAALSLALIAAFPLLASQAHSQAKQSSDALASADRWVHTQLSDTSMIHSYAALAEMTHGSGRQKAHAESLLVAALHDSERFVRVRAVGALAALGPSVHEALPTLARYIATATPGKSARPAK